MTTKAERAEATHARQLAGALAEQWRDQWPDALALWSRFVRLRDPVLCLTDGLARGQGLTESFAMIRLNDQTVVISLAAVSRLGLDDFGLEILAHEIGHHVLCPADLTDQARMLARMRRALPTLERLAPMIANLWADLLINDRLQRSVGLRMADVYRTLATGAGDRLWNLYMRIYEILWSLPRGTLAVTSGLGERHEGDAQLGSRLVRVYGREWVDGSGRFAALCFPYLAEDQGEEFGRLLAPWRDAEHPGRGDEVPSGLTDIEPDEWGSAIHPALDPAISGLEPPKDTPSLGSPGQQTRDPFEYGEILRALGLDLTDHEVAVRYYRERAAKHLIPFPSRPAPVTTEDLPEGFEPWTLGSPLEAIDWTGTVTRSPVVVPGLTTVRRVFGPGADLTPRRQPLDLDLYVDCSGSMPNPQLDLSYLTLAGAVICRSALRAGARVQATLWSGAGQFDTTGGFVTDELAVLRILTGYLGGATAFPIHLLRDTYANGPRERPTHILVISDDGVTTMFDADERGTPGTDVARIALERAGAGGTMALNLVQEPAALAVAREMGWRVEAIRSWADLVAFARRFSLLTYGDPSG